MIQPTEIGSCCFTDLYCELEQYELDPKEDMIDKIKETFEENFNYRPVTINGNQFEFYKTWIFEGNEKDKTIGFKYLLSYPYDEIQFNIGDFIQWDYFHVNGKDNKSELNAEQWSTWLMQSLDYQEIFDSKGRIMLCNDKLRWYDKDKNIFEVHCVVEDGMKYTTWDYGTKGAIIEGADIVVLTQQNDYTRRIKINDRFIFNKRAYVIIQKNDIVNTKFLELYLSKTPELEPDDLENGFAFNGIYNGNIDPKPDVVNGNVLTSPVDIILKGDTVPFSIYNYIDSVKQADTFTVVCSNVPASYYKLEIVDGNNFSIRNINRYATNPLSVLITNNVTLEEIKMTIWLNGAW